MELVTATLDLKLLQCGFDVPTEVLLERHDTQCDQLARFMSLKRHVCRLPFHVKPARDHVWIGEDVLDNAMRQFAHAKITKRFVSLAPGPLEARKRVTKRRMVNLAQVGDAEGVDPALLQGFGGAQERRDWRWESPKPPAGNNIRGTELS